MTFPKFQAERLEDSIQEIEEGPDFDLKEAERDAQIKDIKVRFWVKIAALIVFTIIGAGIVLTYVCHLIFPKEWKWLEPDAVLAIKDLALSIATGVSLSLATKFTIK